ncbi:tRNA (5-methylaminomethyl-2-thiouridine)(34)-methyltransferase MnmD [Litorimonas sp. WD9-15]|uniref:tRNA (5-methylaminomethyl-2-thiouridine)(34)-methyltransferase MnmD n=1 Tax=Litorimonas sp. WD9-15 TaxID=3418716 RepID=UPI003D0259EF
MPAPLPLTQTDAPALDWSRPDTPAASDFGDIYFSTDGGLDETRAVFLNGCGLPERWADTAIFTVAETGFGSGLNFLATWQMWLKTHAAGQRLHFVSIEKFPFDAEQLARALAAWPELTELSAQLIAAWPGRVKGFHRLEFGSVSLTLIHDDISTALDAVPSLKAEAWFLDGFSPSKNEAMWSEEVLAKIGTRSAAGARLATFTVAGHVRRGLMEAGFTVTKQPGFGRKRHRLEAVYEGAETASKTEVGKVLIVGAGIAGRSLARALRRRAIDFDIIDNRAHPAASENPAALVKPRLDLQDRPEARFFLSSYLYALREYQAEAVLSRGVRQIPKTLKETERFEKLAAQNSLGMDHLKWTGDALIMKSAVVIDPSKVYANFEIRRENAEDAISRGPYSHILFAAGYGIKALLPNLDMRFSRGQLSWATEAVDEPLAYGGYVIPMNGHTLVGATHDRLDEGDPFEIRPRDDERNFEAYSTITGRTLAPAKRQSRASVRVTSRDTLPVIDQIDDTKWVLTGLGSRGFTFAPLLAEALVSEICGEVSPLERAVIARFRRR